MEKIMTLNLRVKLVVKQQAKEVLKPPGIPMATAIDMYLRQIKLTGGLPFSVSLSRAPASVNAGVMSADQLRVELISGYGDLPARQTDSKSNTIPLGWHHSDSPKSLSRLFGGFY